MADFQETVTDGIGIADPWFELPSIDGATDVPGLAELSLFDPSDPIDIEVPSIDGASTLDGVTVRTDTELGVIAAGVDVYAELWNAAGDTKLSDLTDSLVDWQDVFNDVGVGTLTLNRHDADASLVVFGTQVRCYLYGDHVFTWIVDSPPELTLLDPDDESTEVLVASGAGRNILARDALVYGPKGIADPLNPAHRLYSFASIDYPGAGGAGWVPATQQLKASELDEYRRQIVEWTYQAVNGPDVVEDVLTPAPLGFPDPDAYWIWGQADRLPVGYNFFRRTFTVQTEETIGFAVTGDNFYTLYLDGTSILGEKVDPFCWRKHKRVDILLPVGTYTLAAVVENQGGVFETAEQNPAGFLCSVFSVDQRTGEPKDFLLRSDSSWDALAYPATWPGWTPGEILIDIIAEAQARGEIPNLTYDFTGSTDSAGNAWPVTQGFSVPIGNTLLDVLNSLVEQGWINYRLAPGGLVLQAFDPDWVQTTSTTLQATGDVATTNLQTFQISPQTTPKTRLYVKWSEGNFQVDDAATQATYGIKPLYVTIDSATKIEAVRRAAVIMNNVKEPQEALQAGLEPTGNDDVPYADFGLGDRVTVPTRAGGTSPEKVLSIAVGHDDIGKATIGLELATRIAKLIRENEELLDQIGSGVTGSDKVRWSLYQTEPLNS